MKLRDRVALVTGGGSGIGHATSALFAQEGARVAVADIDAESAERVARQIEDAGGSAIALCGDVTSREEARSLVADTAERFGALHLLVNSAGITNRQLEPGLSTEDAWARVLDVNLNGTFLMSLYAIEEMKKAGRGAIVNLSSIYGLVGRHESISGQIGAYSASKGGVLQLTRDMGVSLATEGIRVNCLCPGFVDTNLTKEITADPEALSKLEGLTPMGRLGEADEIARAALFLASDDASYITGAALAIDGGYTAQ